MHGENCKHGDEPRSEKFRGIKAYPTHRLMSVILLALRERDSYGYELIKRAAAFGFEAINPGALYRTLRRMEKNGIVKSTWETSKVGPARRLYSVTEAAEAYLDF